MVTTQTTRSVRILALEASTPAGSVCVADAYGVPLASAFAQGGGLQSQRLMPLVDWALGHAGVDRGALTHIAVAAGPGSFTGIRIAVAAAKGLAYALGVPIIPVSTLACLARRVADPQAIVITLLDSRNGSVFAAGYANDGTQVLDNNSGDVSGVIAWAQQHAAGCQGRARFVLVGDGAEKHVPAFEAALSGAVTLAPAHLHTPRAEEVALLATERIRSLGAGAAQAVFEVEPLYVLESYASPR